MNAMTAGIGTRNYPWLLETPSRTSSFQAFGDLETEPAALVCRIEVTVVPYLLRCLGDLYWMLSGYDDWMPLGVADEKGRPPRTRSRLGLVLLKTPSEDGTA